MHIICFSNPQHHMDQVEAVLNELVVDHTETVVVPPFSIPAEEKSRLSLPKTPKGQSIKFFFPQVLMFIYFKGDVPKIVKEIWQRQEAEKAKSQPS